MEVQDLDLEKMTATIWKVIVGQELRRVEGPGNPHGPLMMTGSLSFTGSWEGVIVFTCPFELVREAAAAMFASEPGSVSDTEMQDALGEIANMLGGNLKLVLPAGVHLSLPSVTSGSDYSVHVPHGRVVASVQLTTGKEEFSVELVKSERPPHLVARRHLEHAGAGKTGR